jgi:hypothetical protein
MMYINDDANEATITKETISALKECARMVGKLGPSFSVTQLDEMEAALRLLENALALKRRMKNS